MAKKPTRKPTHPRAKATVDAIIEAGFIAVAEHGMEGATTRHIADVAGIGVGSLYEYFENKEAVYDAMFRRLVNDLVMMIQAQVPALVQMDVRGLIRSLLLTVGELLQRNERRYLICARYAMQADMRVDLRPVSKLLVEFVMLYVMQHSQYMKLRNIPVTNYIFIHGGMYTLMRHLGEENPAIRYEDLVDGLANMVAHYVERELQLVEQSG